MTSAAPAEPRQEHKTPVPRDPRGTGPVWFVESLIGHLVTGTMILSGLCILIVLVIGVFDTTGRAFFNAPFMGAVEISEALLAVAIFASLAYLQRTGGHIVVDVITATYGPRMKVFAAYVILSLTLAVMIFLLWRAGVGASTAWRHNDVSAGFIRVPIWLAKMLTTVGLGVAVIEAARQLVRALFGYAPQAMGPIRNLPEAAQSNAMEKL